MHMPDTFCLIHSLPEVIFEKEFCGSGVEWDRRLCVEFQLHSTLRLWKQELKCKLIMLGRRREHAPACVLSYYNAAPLEGRLVSSLFCFRFRERRTG